MLFEQIYQWYESDVAYHICNTDEYGDPACIDMAATYPTLQNSGEIIFWVQVYDSGTSGTDTYEFQLRGAAANDGTDLSGTTANLVTSPVFTQSGGWCQRTDSTGGFFMGVVPPIAREYRYWQPYIDVTSGDGNLDLKVQMGLGLISGAPMRVGNISHNSGITSP